MCSSLWVTRLYVTEAYVRLCDEKLALYCPHFIVSHICTHNEPHSQSLTVIIKSGSVYSLFLPRGLCLLVCMICNLNIVLFFCCLHIMMLYYWSVVDKVHRSSTWVKVQIRIIKYYSSKSKSTAFSILLEWKYKSTQFFMYLSKKYW